MTTTEQSLSTSTFDDKALATVREAVATFLQRCGLKYTAVRLDEAWYTECCQEAINRGFPMDGNYSIRPYMAAGVAMRNAYSHVPDHATRMWICLFTVVSTCIDDIADKNIEQVYCFNERFANCQPHGHPVLNALDSLLRKTAQHYPPAVSNLIVLSSLNFITSLLIDHETEDMEVSTYTPSYPQYSRLLSGVANAYSFFVFPSTLPLEEYIQCIPDLNNIINYANDILSYYKEEIEGEPVNYVSLMAASRVLTKHDALRVLIEDTVQSHLNILEFLRPRAEAYDAYVNFFQGYFFFHIASGGYKLEEIMMGPNLNRCYLHLILLEFVMTIDFAGNSRQYSIFDDLWGISMLPHERWTGDAI